MKDVSMKQCHKRKHAEMHEIVWIGQGGQDQVSRLLLQLGIDEVGDFTDSVVKLPTLVTLKLA